MLQFVLPTEQNKEDVLAFYSEMEEIGSECIGIGNYKNYGRWLSGMQDRHIGRNLPEGFVRENFYLCYEENRLIGVFSLKFELTEFLLNYGGHIGYATRPSDRKRGLATQILKQGLELAKEFGFERILCVCDKDNYASEKVILKNGGVLEDERYDPYEKVTVKRFWIPLKNIRSNREEIERTMLEFKYDTQLLIEGKNLDEDKISDHFTEHFKGDCLLAVGDDELIKIHFHTNEPWKVLEYCAGLGEIYDIVIEVMDRQARGLKG